MNNRYQIYTDPYATGSSGTKTGVKGSVFLETGYVFTPHIPHFVSDRVRKLLKKAGLKVVPKPKKENQCGVF